MDLAERRKERPQSFLGNQGRQSTNEHCRVIGVRRRELLAVWSDEVPKDRARLCVVLP
jgi:hypothetical protein